MIIKMLACLILSAGIGFGIATLYQAYETIDRNWAILMIGGGVIVSGLLFLAARKLANVSLPLLSHAVCQGLMKHLLHEATGQEVEGAIPFTLREIQQGSISYDNEHPATNELELVYHPPQGVTQMIPVTRFFDSISATIIPEGFDEGQITFGKKEHFLKWLSPLITDSQFSGFRISDYRPFGTGFFLKSYCADFYKTPNRFLREGMIWGFELLEHARTLHRDHGTMIDRVGKGLMMYALSLSKYLKTHGSPYRGEVTRWAAFSPNQLRSLYPQGQNVIERGFLSTSISSAEDNDFRPDVNGEQQRVLFRITTTFAGRDVTYESDLPHELEVLFPFGTHFHVNRVIPTPGEFHGFEITMEEIVPSV